MTTSNEPIRQPPAASRRRFRVPILLTVLTAVGIAVIPGAADRETPPIELNLQEVTSQPFRVMHSFNGIIEPLRSTRVQSDCRWTTRILSILPEGTWVQKGDVVCVLDAADIEAYRQTREVALIRYRARLEAAVQDELLVGRENERRLEAARFAADSADGKLTEYLDGTWPQEMDRLEDEIAVANERLRSAREDLSRSEDLWASGIISRRQHDQDALTYLRDRQRLDELDRRFNLLTQFTSPRKQLQLRYTADNARRNLLRTEISNGLAETRARLSALTYERVVSIYEKYYRRAVSSIEACTVKAPCDGQVIYANSWSLVSRGITEIEEGARVRYCQPLFVIPEPGEYRVRVPVHESLIPFVSRGMPAEASVEGYEDVRIPAEVTRVPHYATNRSRYTPGEKDYWVEVRLLPTPEQQGVLKARMGAEVHLATFEDPSSIVIPRDSVVGAAGENFVMTFDGRDLVPTKIRPAQQYDGKVRVESGLEEGSQVLVSLSDQHRSQLLSMVSDRLQAE